MKVVIKEKMSDRFRGYIIEWLSTGYLQFTIVFKKTTLLLSKSNHALQSELNETLRLQYKVSQSLVLSSSWKLNSCYVV